MLLSSIGGNDINNDDIVGVCVHNTRNDTCKKCSPRYKIDYNVPLTKAIVGGDSVNIIKEDQEKQLIHTSGVDTPVGISIKKPLKGGFSHPQTRLYHFLKRNGLLETDSQGFRKIFMTLDALNEKLEALGVEKIIRDKQENIPKTQTLLFTNQNGQVERGRCKILSKKSDYTSHILYCLSPIFPRKAYNARKNKLIYT